MQIGIIPNLNRKSGGVYQYSIRMLLGLKQIYGKNMNDQFTIFTDESSDPILSNLKKSGWMVSTLEGNLSWKYSLKKKITDLLGYERTLNLWEYQRKLRKKISPLNQAEQIKHRPNLKKLFNNHHIDLMIYTTSNSLSFEAGIPYIFVIHDLQHRLQSEFPEINADGEYEHREYVYRNGIKNALSVIVDSEVGKEDVLNLYKDTGINKERVKMLPFLPANFLEIKIKPSKVKKIKFLYHLPKQYFFYPAQFWPHKNHVRIIEALGLIKDKFKLEIPIVFCGSHVGLLQKQTITEVFQRSKSLGIDRSVHYLDYVEDSHMPVLYKGAEGLIMPTFFGPTNIPILEAWATDCPVITSDIRGIREQAGDAAILVNPRSSESIAKAVRALWTDKKLRESLVRKGKRRLSLYTQNDYNLRLEAIVEEAKKIIGNKKD